MKFPSLDPSPIIISHFRCNLAIACPHNPIGVPWARFYPISSLLPPLLYPISLLYSLSFCLFRCDIFDISIVLLHESSVLFLETLSFLTIKSTFKFGKFNFRFFDPQFQQWKKWHFPQKSYSTVDTNTRKQTPTLNQAVPFVSRVSHYHKQQKKKNNRNFPI